MKFTHDGGITVSWGDSDPSDPKRWALCVADTGPGLHSSSGTPMTQALQSASRAEPGAASEAAPDALPAADAVPAPDTLPASGRPTSDQAGEGIGLSIVKRLCELLDATIEVKSVENVWNDVPHIVSAQLYELIVGREPAASGRGRRAKSK